MRPHHLDLCSGIGGFALAAHWAGFETVGFAEVNPYASAVLAKHWPGVRNYGDIRTADFGAIGDVDLLTAGYPCQPFSYAGKRGGEGDDRHLWPAVLRVIEVTRPTWVCCENVVGHITMGLDTVLSDLAAAGYARQPLVIPAGGVGAWQERQRVWIIAHLEGVGLQSIPNECQSQDPARGGADVDGRFADVGDESNPDSLDEHLGRFRYGQLVTHGHVQAEARDGAQWWATEPGVGRVVHGVPHRLDRIAGLGNAIVPQVAYQILNAIREHC